MAPPRTYTHPEPSEIRLERVLYALSDPIRLEMVRRLHAGGEADSLSLADNLPRSTLTYHTRILRESGLTLTRSSGRSCLIDLREEDLNHLFPGLMNSLFRVAGEPYSTEGR